VKYGFEHVTVISWIAADTPGIWPSKESGGWKKTVFRGTFGFLHVVNTEKYAERQLPVSRARDCRLRERDASGGGGGGVNAESASRVNHLNARGFLSCIFYSGVLRSNASVVYFLTLFFSCGF